MDVAEGERREAPKVTAIMLGGYEALPAPWPADTAEPGGRVRGGARRRRVAAVGS